MYSIAAACAGFWLRGRDNIAKRYLIHVAGFNLGVLMRAFIGLREAERTRRGRQKRLFVRRSDG